MNIAVNLILGDTRSSVFEPAIIDLRKRLNLLGDECGCGFDTLRIFIKTEGIIWNKNLGENLHVGVRKRLKLLVAKVDVPMHVWESYAIIPEDLVRLIMTRVVESLSDYVVKSKTDFNAEEFGRVLTRAGVI